MGFTILFVTLITTVTNICLFDLFPFSIFHEHERFWAFLVVVLSLVCSFSDVG